MGTRAGFRSGELIAERAKIGDRHIITSINLPLKTFQLETGLLSGTASTAYTTLSGIYSFGWAHVNAGKAGNSIKIPDNIAPKTKANVNVYWSASGNAAATAAVFDVDYRVVNRQISGVIQSPARNYTTSGTTANASTTHKFISGIVGTVNALQKTTVSIPDSAIVGGGVLLFGIFRDTSNATDTLNSQVWVNAVDVEFVDG